MAGRYRVTDRRYGGAYLHAQDVYSGEPVLLRALELPVVLTEDHPFDREAEEEPGPGARIADRLGELAARAPGHPRLLRGIAAVAETGAGALWTVEEWQPGVPLAEAAEAGPLPPYRVAEIGADLAGALAALHRAGLTHGNVTADSVLVCEDGAALLGGLLPGAAEEALCAEVGGPVPRRVAETRAALLPVRAERWPAGEGPEADCWALGVLLHRLLTGRSPYPEDSLPVLLASVRAGGPPVADGCGPLRPLVEALVAADPAARPTAPEIGRHLAALLALAPEPHRAEPAAALPVPRPRGGGRSASLRPLLLGGLLLAVVALVAGAVLR